jgi:hypothetical protein
MTTTLDTSIFMFGKYNGFVSKARVSACMYFLVYNTISLFLKEVTVHSGIVWRDKIYGDRRQICERVEVSTVR